MSRESTMDNSIIDGLDELYRAYARASRLARDNQDWSLIAERLYYAMSELERAVKLLVGAGTRLAYSGLKPLLRRIDDRVSAGDLVGAASVSEELDSVVRRIRVINNIYSIHLCMYRVVTVLAIALAVFLLPMQGPVMGFLALLSVSLALAGILGCYESLSISVIMVSIIILYIITIMHLLTETARLGLIEYISLLTAWLGGIALYIESRRASTLYSNAMGIDSARRISENKY